MFFSSNGFADWCSDNGYPSGSCVQYNTACVSSQPRECHFAGWSGVLPKYCYTDLLDTCTSSQTCFDPSGVGSTDGAQCMTKGCYNNNVYYYKESGVRSDLKQTCNSNQVCISGSCVTKVCTPNSKWCDSSTVMTTCSSDGTYANSQSGAYCFQPGTGNAYWVNCLTNSHCGSGYICDSILHTCVQDCSPSTYSYKCDSATGDVYYYNRCNVKTTRKQDCTSNQVCKINSCVTKICTPGATRCASETVIETCTSDGTEWQGQSAAYCLSVPGGATIVQCLRDSQCSSDKQCLQNVCTPRPCVLNSVSWSRTSAVQWDAVTMTVSTSYCNGKQVTFSVWENDGILPDDKIADFIQTVSNNSASYTWTAPFIEDQAGDPEYYFQAKYEAQTKTSVDLPVSPSTTDTEFTTLNTVIMNGQVTIVTYSNPSGEALNYLNGLKTAIQTRSGIAPRVISHTVTTSCFDYANLSTNLILIGDENINSDIYCLKSLISDRAIKDAEVQLELEQNPWVSGKYAIIVQGSDYYYEGIAALKIMVQKGTDPSWKLSDSVVGCLWTGDLSLGGEIACNVIPVVELAPDVRDTIKCVNDKVISLAKKEETTFSGMVNELFCGVVYAGTAYDVVSNAALIGGFFTFGATAVGAGAMELNDPVLATFKVTFKSVLNGLDTVTLQKAYKVYKKMPGTGRALVKAVKNMPSMTTTSIKALVNLLAEGDLVAEKGLKLLDKCGPSFDELDSAKVVDAARSLFKVETQKGIIVNVVAEEQYVKTVMKLAQDEKFFNKVGTVTTALGATTSVKEIKFVDTIAGNAGALGSTATDGTIQLAVGNPGFISKPDYSDILLHNTLPHEITHSTLIGKIPTDAANDAAEEFVVDKTLRTKLTGTDLSQYRNFEETFLETNDYFAEIAANYEKGMTKSAASYAEAVDYDNLYAKTLIHNDMTGYFNAAYKTAKGVDPSPAQTEKMWNKFLEQSASIRASTDNFLSTKVWIVVPLIPLSAVLAAADTAPPTCTAFNYSSWSTCINGTQTRTVISSTPTGCTGGNPLLTQSCTVTCTSFSYSAWSACVNGSQSRTILSSSPSGCTGGNPLLTQSCTPPTCTSFSYSAWSACINNLKTRTVVSASPTGCTGGNPSLTQSCTSPACSVFTYSAWSACVNGTQTRTVISSAPTGCVGGNPTLSQSCSSPTCTTFNYSAWSACNNNVQTRTILSSSPTGCTGGNPVLSQSCTSPTCTGFTYSAWSACSNGTQTRSVVSATPSGCVGGNPTLTQSCSAPTCTSFTYNAWGACMNNVQTRTVATATPTGCTGGNPILSQSCTSPTCTAFTYSAWSACSNGSQTRTILSSTPTGCTGGNPVLTQSCTVTCTSFTYSAWSACINNSQSRTIVSSTPTGCTGGNPVLTQTCTSPQGTVKFRTTALGYTGGAAVAYSQTCGGTLTAFGETSGACSEYNCNTSTASFMVPFTGGATAKAWARTSGEDVCICNGNTLPRRFNISDSDASKVSTSTTSANPTMELLCS